MDLFTINLEEVSPVFVRPDLLCHPQIPKAAAGLNPRTVKGREWWDTVRREAYAVNNLCCWACGIYGGDDPYKPGLEAHECYDIYYYAGILVLKQVVALCHRCHSFIHSGRLMLLLRDGEITLEHAQDIMFSRYDFLRLHGLQPFYATLANYYSLRWDMEPYSALMQVSEEGYADIAYYRSAPREDWLLVVEGEVYDINGEKIADQ